MVPLHDRCLNLEISTEGKVPLCLQLKTDDMNMRTTWSVPFHMFSPRALGDPPERLRSLYLILNIPRLGLCRSERKTPTSKQSDMLRPRPRMRTVNATLSLRSPMKLLLLKGLSLSLSTGRGKGSGPTARPCANANPSVHRDAYGSCVRSCAVLALLLWLTVWSWVQPFDSSQDSDSKLESIAYLLQFSLRRSHLDFQGS